MWSARSFTVAALFVLVVGPAWIQTFPIYEPIASDVSEFGPSSQRDAREDAEFLNQLYPMLYRQLRGDGNRKWPVNVAKSKFASNPVATPPPKRNDEEDDLLPNEEHGQFWGSEYETIANDAKPENEADFWNQAIDRRMIRDGQNRRRPVYYVSKTKFHSTPVSSPPNKNSASEDVQSRRKRQGEEEVISTDHFESARQDALLKFYL